MTLIKNGWPRLPIFSISWRLLSPIRRKPFYPPSMKCPWVVMTRCQSIVWELSCHTVPLSYWLPFWPFSSITLVGACIPLFPRQVGESQCNKPLSRGKKEVTLVVNGLRYVRSIFLLVRLELRGCRSHSPFMSWRKTALPSRSWGVRRLVRAAGQKRSRNTPPPSHFPRITCKELRISQVILECRHPLEKHHRKQVPSVSQVTSPGPGQSRYTWGVTHTRVLCLPYACWTNELLRWTQLETWTRTRRVTMVTIICQLMIRGNVYVIHTTRSR